MQDAIHRTACTLKRSFKSIHSPADVFLERVSHKDMVVSPVPVIRARTREVIDSLVYVISRGEGDLLRCWSLVRQQIEVAAERKASARQ